MSWSCPQTARGACRVSPLAYARQVLLDAANEIEKQLPKNTDEWAQFREESIKRMEACRKVAAAIDISTKLPNREELIASLNAQAETLEHKRIERIERGVHHELSSGYQDQQW